MKTTLKERITQALKYRQANAAPGDDVSQAALARFCQVAPASVNAWFSGETKALKGASLVKASVYLKVRPEWLASGSGLMEESEDGAGSQHAHYFSQGPAPLVDAARAIAAHLRDMAPNQRKGAAMYLKQVIDECENDQEVESLLGYIEALKNVQLPR